MTSPVLTIEPLGPPPWPTDDPFLFCVYHHDAYPKGNADLGPAASLQGRDLGMDFAGIDNWRMYHGQTVPGFPQHPHRGFETVTMVRKGFVDHTDSLGATARYGQGDTQWLTAGSGIVHAEMFPLLHEDKPNPLELFQIWLNLPAKNKMCTPYFKMLWSHALPVHKEDGAEVLVVAGALDERRPPSPPPDSWAAHDDADVAIWTIRLASNGTFMLPAARKGTQRSLYLFDGEARVGEQTITQPSRIRLLEGTATELASAEGAEFLLLQGKPIGEPIAHHGPFVMNTRAELQQAFLDYQRTQFGGWPWDRDDPVHAKGEGRHARRADGELERPMGPANE